MNTESSSISPHLWQKPLSPIVKIGIAILGLIVILVLMTINIKKYETHLAMGETVLLELAPVDPRGLMQGDFMRLNFAIADDIRKTLQDKSRKESNEGDLDNTYWMNIDGIVVVNLDDNNVAHFERLIPIDSANATIDKANLASNEKALHFRIRNGTVKFATNAFFFQEGHAKDYEAAEYGLFRVNDAGEPLLTNMVNSDFEVIKGGAAHEDDVDD